MSTRCSTPTASRRPSVADLEDVLAQLRELEHEDAEKDALALDLHALLERVRTLRGATIGVQVTRADLPARRDRAVQDLQRSRDEVEAARAALAEAEEAVRSAAKSEGPTAERFLVRARDRGSIAERRRTEAEAHMKDVEESVHLLEAFALELEAAGRSLADELRDRPRVAEGAGIGPAPGLDGLLEWADAAHAALFVAKGQLSTERDAVIRQANELGSVALGESIGSASVALVARRIEQALPR